MFNSLTTNINDWTTQDLDSILFSGSEFYGDILERNHIPRPRYLGVDDILGFHSIYGIEFFVEKFVMFHNNIPLFDSGNLDLYVDFVYTGNISYDDLLAQIQLFFNSTCLFALFVCNDYTYGFLKQQNRIFLFDSHAKTHNGLPSDDGKSSLRTFSSLNELTNYMLRINLIRAYYQMIYLNIQIQDQSVNIQNTQLVNSFSTMSFDESNFSEFSESTSSTLNPSENTAHNVLNNQAKRKRRNKKPLTLRGEKQAEMRNKQKRKTVNFKRSYEPPEKVEKRLDKQREYQNFHRLLESDQDNQTRLANQRDYQNFHRLLESDQDNQARLENKRDYQNFIRLLESDQDNQTRIANQRDYQNFHRLLEND